MKQILFIIYSVLLFSLYTSCSQEEPLPDGDSEPSASVPPDTIPDTMDTVIYPGPSTSEDFTVPLLEISTTEYLPEIKSKETYVSASLKLKGYEVYKDVEAEFNIKGRGNTSWGMPKKPYRLKFDKKISLCGLPKAKSYVLLANYTDPSLMQFAIATKIAQMLEIPYTNRIVPVEVSLNGIYKGAYILTNKPGINSGSVDIDEKKSVMWEIDTYYDEEPKFMSPILGLPVMLADPDMSETDFARWKEDFCKMEEAVVEGRGIDAVDIDAFARYLLVYIITRNQEVQHPKSVKLYKTEGGKYIFGPIWDFDLAFGSTSFDNYYYIEEKAKSPLRLNRLFSLLVEYPEFNEAITKHWNSFKIRIPELMTYIDQYHNLIQNSGVRNMEIWTHMKDFNESVAELKNWLTIRLEAVDSNNLISNFD